MAEKTKPGESDTPPLLESIEQFLFQLPLYAEYTIGDNLDRLNELYGRVNVIVDGYCMWCGRDATFNVRSANCPDGHSWQNIRSRIAFDEIEIICTRNDNHETRFWFLKNKRVVQKVGQYPSLADIANDEVKIYRKLLSDEMASEFHKAIGLAAHGVGVGSFVYLRRVFEWLIENRFDEFKKAESWDAKKFQGSRMEDKIDHLKDHLPEFLVSHREIYKILSIGIHELSEQDCLSYFDVMKRSIIMILEDDKKAREEREQRKAFGKAIKDFKSPRSAGKEENVVDEKGA